MTDLRKAAEGALEDICGVKLCEVNSMSSRAVPTYTIQELAYSKGVSAPVRDALLGMQEKLARYIKIHDAVFGDADKAYELLRWAETEMRYAGWDVRINDQQGRTDVYESIVEFLK